MLGPRTHKRYLELKQNTYSGYAERRAHTHTHTHTHTHKDAGKKAWEVVQAAEDPWRHQGMCAQGVAGVLYTAHTPSPQASPELQFGISSGAGPELQEMSPSLSRPGRSLWVARPVWVPGPSGPAPQEDGQAQACCMRAGVWRAALTQSYPGSAGRES
ncbi:unnamed protein product [Rangifer tarandus platyrhynchus]|uniref:Uncharacterized protein n=2 Tax=Rangifer tarandus platyrhynchus TaxID=3082113 RepID=A0AC59Z4X3_RANTA|nr:unnamed protein product [Rangifer tarandus platyrhynchus]